MASVRSRSSFRFSSSRTPLAAAVLALAGAARAEGAPPAQGVPPVQTVQGTARSISETAGVTGFAQPLARTPISVDVIDAQVLKDLGATSLSDLTRIDASLPDSYN